MITQNRTLAIIWGEIQLVSEEYSQYIQAYQTYRTAVLALTRLIDIHEDSIAVFETRELLKPKMAYHLVKAGRCQKDIASLQRELEELEKQMYD